MQVSVRLLLPFNLQNQLVRIQFSILGPYLLLAQFLLKLPVDDVQLFDLPILRLNHFCQLVFAHAHLSENLFFPPEFVFRFVLVNCEAPFELVLHFILLAFELMPHLALKVFLRLFDALVHLVLIDLCLVLLLLQLLFKRQVLELHIRSEVSRLLPLSRLDGLLGRLFFLNFRTGEGSCLGFQLRPLLGRLVAPAEVAESLLFDARC